MIGSFVGEFSTEGILLWMVLYKDLIFNNLFHSFNVRPVFPVVVICFQSQSFTKLLLTHSHQYMIFSHGIHVFQKSFHTS